MSDTPAAINLRMKLRHVVAMERPLAEVGQLKGVPTKIAYRLGRVLSKLQPEMQVFNDKRQELIKLYGEVNEENNSVTIPPEKVEQFQADLEPILDEEIDVFPNFFPIDLGAFQKVEKEIAPIHVMALLPMLAEQPFQGKDLVLPLRVVLGFESALTEILTVKGLPILTAYKLARFVDHIQPILTGFLAERKVLIDKYSDKSASDVAPGQVRISQEHAAQFQQDNEVLLSRDVTIPNWLPIKGDDLGEGEGINSMQIAALMPLLDMDEMMEAQPVKDAA